MTKILLIRNAYRFDFGGGERVPVELAAELQNLGYQAMIVSRSPKLLAFARSKQVPALRGWWWRFQNWSGVYLLLTPIYFLWQLLLTTWYFGLIIGTHADIVHPQSRDDFIAATIAGKLLGKPVVWTDHADLKYIYRNVPIWYKNPIGKLVFRLSRHARLVILVSDNEKNHIRESLCRPVPDNYQVIYNGVPSEAVAPIKRPKEDAQAVIFAATSRLVTAKGIGELIEAFKEIDNGNARLWLFGEGPEETIFKAQAEGNPHIVFWGFPEDSLRRVADADVFVHPSYHEGFSISLIEAAKLGLPIIACDVGGNPELVADGQNGILVPAKDNVSLAEAMKKLLNDAALRKKYGAAARKTYEENFVFEKIVKEKIAPLYE